MMKKILILMALAAVLFASCGRSGQYRIHGRVLTNDLEGVQIFLVPVGHEEKENVDSVRIHDHEFFFKGKEHWMCALRLDKRHRDKGQNLLVVTEPGDIYVVIGPDSSGGGTPQNDSAQVWKNLTVEANRIYSELYQADMKEEANAARREYRNRSRRMALGLGEDSIFGAFLLNMYPLPMEE